MQLLELPRGATPRTPKSVATRERLLAAASETFGRLGYEGTRIADIVASAGISHGLFYRYFTDKDDVLTAVLAKLNASLRHHSARSAHDELVPSLAQLQQRNIQFFREYASDRLLLRVSREAAARTGADTFRCIWLKIRERYAARTRRWIDRLEAEGHIAPLIDAHMIAEGLCAMTEQLAYVQIGLADLDPGDADIERLGRACGLIWHRTLFGAV